jgi:exopolysaccharide biosynthesis polyprenyl glycosylphosphotransferase
VTNISLPVAGAREYDVPRLAHPRHEPKPWTGPRSLLWWDLALATAGALTVTSTLLTVPTLVTVVLPLGWCLALKLSRATEVAPVGTLAHTARRLLSAGAMVALAGSAASTGLGSTFTSGDAFVAALTCTGASLVGRVAIWKAAGLRGVQERPRVLVIGDERQHAAAALERRAGPALSVISMRLDPGPDGAEPAGNPAVGVADIASYAARVGACSVVVMPEAGLDPAALRRLQWLLEAARLPLYVGTGIVGASSSRLEATDVSGVPLVRVHAVRRSGPGAVVVDLAGRCAAALALLVLLPFLLLLGVAIRRESPGPALFRQQRVGQDGRPFTIYKLRTMGIASPGKADLANDSDGVLFKMRTDPRVTPLGRRLRKYSIDELPQLLNVLLGQMRLVGPRPALPNEVAAYSEDMLRRLAVPPGLTGLWQVSGRSDLSWEDTVRLDLHYVDNWSSALDLLILCRTLQAVLGHRGAY